MKVLKWIAIAIGAFVLFGRFFPEIYGPPRSYAESSTTDVAPVSMFKVKIINHYEDISKQFYHCEAIAETNDIHDLDELANYLIYMAKDKACGVLHVYKSIEGIRYQQSESYAKKHPEASDDYICVVYRDQNQVEWNQAFLDALNN